jgi:hypothetical protein
MNDAEVRALALDVEREAHWARVEAGAMQIAAALCRHSITPAGTSELALLAIRIARAIVHEVDRANLTEAGVMEDR